MDINQRIVEVERALNAAAKNRDGSQRESLPVASVRKIAGAAIADADASIKRGREMGLNVGDLLSARIELAAWRDSIPVIGDLPIAVFRSNRPRISRVYIEMAGLLRNVPGGLSLGSELIASVQRLPDTLATAAKATAAAVTATAGFVGDTAGALAGGLLAGLWPLLLVLGVVLLGALFLKKKGVL